MLDDFRRQPPVGSQFGLGEVHLGPYRNHYSAVLRPLFDDGDGMGEGAGEGEGGGGGEGEGEGGGGAFDGFDLSAAEAGEKLVRIPGVKDPIKVKDLIGSHSLRSQHEAGLKTMGQLAKALAEKQKGGGGEGDKKPVKAAAGAGGDRETKDVLAQLEAEDLLQGKTVASVLREIQNGTLNPLTKLVVGMAKELKELRGHVTSTRQREFEGEFGSEVDRAMAALKLPGGGDKGDQPLEGADVVKEIIRDLVSSYDEADQPKLKGETLSKLVTERFTALKKFFVNYQKAELAAAERTRRQRIFTRPGTSTSPNGKPRKMMTNRERANILFSGTGADA